MILGFMVEGQLGPVRMAIFFFITTIGGNLFGATLNPAYAIGPEPLMFGLFAALVGMCAVYWDRLGDNVSRKACMVFIIVLFMVLMYMFFSAMASIYEGDLAFYSIHYPDTEGWLGGFLFGLFASFTLLPPHENGFLKGKEGRTLTLVGLIGTILLLTLMTILFILSDIPVG